MNMLASHFSDRTRPARYLALFMLLSGLWGCSASPNTTAADIPREAITVRYLGIGNSFTYNAIVYLRHLAEADGNKLILGRAIMNGGSLERHVTKLDAWKQDPSQAMAAYDTGQTLAQTLDQRDWDYISIQQQSYMSHDPATYQPFADALVAFIRERDPGAELLINQTWAYRTDDPRFRNIDPRPGEPNSRAEMHEMVDAAYRQLAEHFDARLMPVGNAFDLAERDPVWGFKPEPINREAYTQPALPDQRHSLHLGWLWRNQKLIYDGNHANAAGRYLAGCVLYEVLFESNVVGNSFVPAGFDSEYARFLQQTAHRAVAAAAAGMTAGK